MSNGLLFTDADVARARRDPVFRQKILTETLSILLAELHKQQKSANPSPTGQIREASMIAARLADIIRDLDSRRTSPNIPPK